MPTYLCHGFRWHRRSIRVYVVVQNLDDASPEWIIPARSSNCILESFYGLFDFLPYCAPRSSRSSGGMGVGPYGGPIIRLPSADSDEDAISNGAYVLNTAAPAAMTIANGNDTRISGTGAGGRSRSQSLTQSRSLSCPRSRGPSLSNPPPPSRPPPPPGLGIVGTNANASASPGGAASSSTDGYSIATGAGGGWSAHTDDIRAQDWSVIKLLEEYDPMNLNEVSRPYAYVADYVVRVDLSASIVEEMARYEERVRADADPAMTGGRSDETGRGSGGGFGFGNLGHGAGSGAANGKRGASGKRGGGAGAGGDGGAGGVGVGAGPPGNGWLEKLRDQLQRGEDIRWYVVVNGDEVRDWPDEPERKTDQIREHHAQYSHQQLLFEGKDKSSKRLPREPGVSRTMAPNGVANGDEAKAMMLRPGLMDKMLHEDKNRGRDRARQEGRGRSKDSKDWARDGDRTVPRGADRMRPIFMDKELPPLRTKLSLDGVLRPKTPSRVGLRRLFGRAKAEEVSPSG